MFVAMTQLKEKMKKSRPSRIQLLQLSAFMILSWDAFVAYQFTALPNSSVRNNMAKPVSSNDIQTVNHDNDDMQSDLSHALAKGKLLETAKAELLTAAKAELLKTEKAELVDTARAELLDVVTAEHIETAKAERVKTVKAELLESTKAELVKTTKVELSDTAEAKLSVANHRSTTWYPQYYSTNLTRLLNRGVNLITPASGCMMATWVVTTGPLSKAWDCNLISHAHQKIEGKEHLVQAYDTIYVPVVNIGHFTENIMPKINAPVVVIAGQFHRFKMNLDEDWERNFLPLYSNPNVLKIFCQNAIKYAHQHDPKLEPFPYGFKHIRHKRESAAPVDIFRQAFLRHLELPEKTTDVLVGYVQVKNNPSRINMPNGPKLLTFD